MLTEGKGSLLIHERLVRQRWRVEEGIWDEEHWRVLRGTGDERGELDRTSQSL